MVEVDQTEPPGIVDRLLWRDAQSMLGRHAQHNHDGSCLWCGWQWPCPPHRLAERAEAASRQPWREAWTARHDLNSIRTLPGWRSDFGELEPDGATRRARHAAANRGLFD